MEDEWKTFQISIFVLFYIVTTLLYYCLLSFLHRTIGTLLFVDVMRKNLSLEVIHRLMSPKRHFMSWLISFIFLTHVYAFVRAHFCRRTDGANKKYVDVSQTDVKTKKKWGKNCGIRTAHWIECVWCSSMRALSSRRATNVQ